MSAYSVHFNDAIKAINYLTYEELLELNGEVIRRIRSKGKARNSAAKVEFMPDDAVEFPIRDGRILTGRIIKCNRSTAIVQTDGIAGSRWKVRYMLLRRKQ